ncbi:DUF4382 domain-containing protein [Ulvibacter antarcticus]|uniref:Uncharacterized protein DUF4382 n=1 Tax=Ulvibacter antarcticus TaxID=442714 RepID=A0A3L9Z3X8_9FLAO|nr:DUF4382 domain-containing protein [Ulvibacter antarcticus]RMA66129.1 uncharacterized protein DUF4382 [Ulvibacter antarcticus]
MKNLIKLSVLTILLLGFVACSDDENSNSTEGTSRMSVKLVDAPGDYDAVFIDVQDVVIKYNGNENDVSIGAINAGVYDLLELTAGVSGLLVDDEIPAGSISQIRLILGENNSIVVDGETIPLNTPSAQQSGLKIQVNETLEPGIFYEFILDFDVEQSIVALGNGGYNLKPVIRASTVAETGSISGNVLPLGVQTLITANNGVNEISTYVNPITGAFVLSGVPDGTYTITFEADIAVGLPVLVLEDVVVTNGNITALGTVDLNP